MNKFTKIFLCIILVVAIAVTAVACTKTDENGLIILKAPKVGFNGNTVIWKSVKNADKYGVIITNSEGQHLNKDGQVATEDEDKEIVVESTSYPLINFRENLSIKVRAIGDEVKYGYSEYSQVLTYDPYTQLLSPDNVLITANEDLSVKVSWNAVDQASSYSLELWLNSERKEVVSVSGIEHTFGADNFKGAGVYKFKIQAIGDGGDILNSRLESVEYAIVTKLDAPKNVVMSASDNTATISFEKVEYATKYIIQAMLEGEVYDTTDSVTIGSDTVSWDITKFKYEKAGKYTYRVRAARKEGSAYNPESEWVEVNLKSDATKKAEMTLYPAPTNFKMEGDKLVWDTVEGAPKYTIEIKSNTNTYTDTANPAADAATAEFDLSKCVSLFGNNAASTAGGKVVFLNVYVPGNYKDGILKGIVTDKNYAYQSSETPEIKDSVYQVKNLMHIAFMNKEPNAKYKLVGDIDANKSYVYGMNVAFGGEFDGNGYTLRNFNFIAREGESKVSMFGDIAAGGVVKNITMIDPLAQITKNTYTDKHNVEVAFIANTNAGTIDNVNISYSVSNMATTPNVETEARSAGVAIVNSGTISNCSVQVSISAHYAAGGICVDNKAKLYNNRVYGSHIVAKNFKPASTATSAVEVDNTKAAYTGGVAAINSGTIQFCTFQGGGLVNAKAFGTDYVAISGGLVGYMTGGSISDSFVSRSTSDADKDGVVAENTAGGNYDNIAFAGGFIGQINGGSITRSYNKFYNVKAVSLVGGFAGKVGEGVTITNGYTLNSSKLSARSIGGVAGENKGTFSTFAYSKYETGISTDSTKPGIGHLPGGGTISGIIDINKAEDMLKLNIEGFVLNELVDDKMILSTMPYFAKDTAFRVSIKKADSAEKTNVAKVYFGDKVIEEPTTLKKRDEVRIGRDEYVIKDGETIQFVINRVIQVA